MCASAPAAPESTTRLPALRRSRLEMWSRRYRCSSRPGSVSCALQLVDQRDLPADQVLGTAADVTEHLRHVAPAGDLPLDQPGGGALHPVEGAGQVADLVAGRGRRPAPAGPAVALSRLVVGDPDQLGLGDPGDPVGGAGEPGQRPGHRPRDRRTEQHHQQQDQRRRGADQVRGGQRPPLLGRSPRR